MERDIISNDLMTDVFKVFLYTTHYRLSLFLNITENIIVM